MNSYVDLVSSFRVLSVHISRSIVNGPRTRRPYKSLNGNNPRVSLGVSRIAKSAHGIYLFHVFGLVMHNFFQYRLENDMLTFNFSVTSRMVWCCK